MASLRSLRSLDYGIWKAFAGGSARVPAAGELVYYFPQGHVEHALSPPDFSFLHGHPPFFLCRVSSVSLFAHPASDEVYAQISLDRCSSNAAAPAPLGEEKTSAAGGAGGAGGTGVVSFSKVLTPSDANNGGGFSVPRFCADSIFPTLDYKADPPVQTLSVLDVHGNAWEFRHIYRGTPRRHLLTTGWSKFVNSKKLLAGDSIIFARNPTGQIIVGIRRTSRNCSGLVNCPIPSDLNTKHKNPQGKEGFSTSTRCRVSMQLVVEAVSSAETGRPFEVLYYPKDGWPEIVVTKDLVEASMTVPWRPGTRIKMAVDTEESSRTRWFHGTVSCITVPEHGWWARSPWRMLQVNWDEPEVLQNVKTVNPWQVELMSSTSPCPAMKKLKLLDGVEVPVEGQGPMVFPMTGFGGPEMGCLTSSLFNLNSSPSGKQGARHILSSFSANFAPNNTNKGFSENPSGIDMWNSDMPRLIIATPPDEGNNKQQPRVEIFSTGAFNPTRKSRKGSIQLFGQIIQIEQLAETNVSTDFSLSFPHKRLLEGQPRLSAVGACE